MMISVAAAARLDVDMARSKNKTITNLMYAGCTDGTMIKLPNGDQIKISNSMLRVIAAAGHYSLLTDGASDAQIEKAWKFYQACVAGDRRI